VASAQEGRIAGVVVDAEEGEPLTGATVRIVDTDRGAATDLDGRYRFTGLVPGTYDLRFSYVGFQEKVVEGVEVTAGETTRLDIDLNEDSEELDEVVVTAQAARDSEAGLLRRRQRAPGVSDAISAEAISRSGAGNAADAMSKVTGASVLEGKYVNMRGLQGRYVNAQLNGTNLPSADPEGNSVALDLFPASLIDNIISTKTFSPDRPGNATGGSIDISTKSLPDAFFLNLSISSSSNSEVGLGGDMVRTTGGLDEIPAIARNQELPASLGQTFGDPDKAQLLDEASRAFAAPISPVQETVSFPDNRSFELSLGNQLSVFNGRTLGFIASGSYNKSSSGFTKGRTARFEQTGLNSANLNPTAEYTTRRGTEATLLGSLVGVTFLPAPGHEFQALGTYNIDDENQARTESGRLPRDLSGSQQFQTRVQRKIERSVWSGELKGTHQFNTGFSDAIRAEWSASLSQATRDEPDYRLFSNSFDVSSNGDSTFAISPSIFVRPARYFRDLEEDDTAGALSIEVPFDRIIFKTGGSLQLKSRTFRERRFDHVSDDFSYDGDPDAYVDERAGLIGEDDRGRPQYGTYVLDRTESSNNYDGDQDIFAGFIMTEFQLPGLPSVEFVGGLRVEQTDMSIVTVNGDREGRFEETDLMPSANLRWALRDDMNLRAAYGRTIARPSFREFAPFESFNFVGDYLEVGNPDLTRTRVHNLDLRLEWFMRGGELLSAGAFYKSFDDPIERTINPVASGANTEVSYRNKGSATVYGAEFEARKRLDQLASWLRHLQVGVNVTLIQSAVDRSEDELEAIGSFDDDPSTTRALQGQSPYIVNLNASYENPDSGTSINVLFNRFGDRLDTVTRNGLDLFEQARSALDFTMSQRVMNNVRVKGSVKNILDNDFVVSQSFGGETFVNDRYPLGRTVSLGVSYAF